MLQYQKQFSLKNYNTFGIDVLADQFISINTIDELKEVLKQHSNIFILGGGSNMLFTKNLNKTAVHLNILGTIVNNQNNNTVEVTAYAGENWHEFVLWTVNQNFGGLENLSLIPGNVGACPIQNIGAYGTEVKNTILYVEALNIESLKIEKITNAECEFDYRNSIFKNQQKGKYIILSVTFKLTTKNHDINIDYGDIKNQLKNNINPSLKQISDAIIDIRNSKLPNPKEIGNSGSFFKNPVIDLDLFNQLKKQHPNIPFYVVSETKNKIPAGWLIEKAGFKGKKFGNTGVHHKQALVLVNYGNAKGAEVYALAKNIQHKIKEMFLIDLEIEVNIF